MKVTVCGVCGHQWVERKLCSCQDDGREARLLTGGSVVAYLIATTQDGNVPHRVVTLDSSQAERALQRGASVERLVTARYAASEANAAYKLGVEAGKRGVR